VVDLHQVDRMREGCSRCAPHALNTHARTAACIDLDPAAHADLWTLRLVVPHGRGALRVNGAGIQALVDRRTFAVSKAPSRPPDRPSATTATHSNGHGFGDARPWAAAAALAAPAGLTLVAIPRRSGRITGIEVAGPHVSTRDSATARNNLAARSLRGTAVGTSPAASCSVASTRPPRSWRRSSRGPLTLDELQR
jgi:hypothetical protein